MPGTVAVLLAAVLFGTTGTARALGPDAATSLAVGGLRIAIGALVLAALAVVALPASPDLMRPPKRLEAPACRTGGSPHNDATRYRWRGGMTTWWLVGGLGAAAYQPSFFAGTERSGVALGTIVALGSGPAFAGVLDAALFRRRPPSAWVRSTAVALTGGVVLVAAQGGAARLDAVGIVCSLTAGASYAVFAVAARAMIVRGVDSTVAMAGVFAVGAVVLLPFVAAQPLEWATTGAGLLMLAHLGLVTVGAAYWLYGWGLRSLATSTAVTLTLAEPVTAAVAGAVVLDERLPVLAWVGAVIVVTGLALSGRSSATS